MYFLEVVKSCVSAIPSHPSSSFSSGVGGCLFFARQPIDFDLPSNRLLMLCCAFGHLNLGQKWQMFGLGLALRRPGAVNTSWRMNVVPIARRGCSLERSTATTKFKGGRHLSVSAALSQATLHRSRTAFEGRRWGYAVPTFVGATVGLGLTFWIQPRGLFECA